METHILTNSSTNNPSFMFKWLPVIALSILALSGCGEKVGQLPFESIDSKLEVAYTRFVYDQTRRCMKHEGFDYSDLVRALPRRASMDYLTPTELRSSGYPPPAELPGMDKPLKSQSIVTNDQIQVNSAQTTCLERSEGLAAKRFSKQLGAFGRMSKREEDFRSSRSVTRLWKQWSACMGRAGYRASDRSDLYDKELQALRGEASVNKSARIAPVDAACSDSVYRDLIQLRAKFDREMVKQFSDELSVE